jgi:hypothetical protein
MSATSVDTAREQSLVAPALLRERQQWLVWKFESYQGDKKPRKVPYYVNGQRRQGLQGSDEDRSCLASFETAGQTMSRQRYDGIGFAFLPGDGLIGIDLDNVIDADTGEISERALNIIKACSSYTEHSPSRKGVHIFVAGESETFKSNAIGVEVFCGRQFFTFTGDRYSGTPSEISAIAPDVLKRLRLTVKGSPVINQQRTYPAPRIRSQGEELDRVEDALAYVSSDEYHVWMERVPHALKWEFGDGAFDVWDRWSSKSAKYPGTEACRRRWDTVKPAGRVTLGTIYALAKEGGWVPPRKQAAIQGAQPVAPKEQQESDNSMQSNLARIEDRRTIAPEPTNNWPEPLDPAAFYGLAGDIVKQIEPQTEADMAAILLQVLVSFGALVGRGPHVRVEGDQHHGNLFSLIVGDTAKARKGTSWSRVRELFSRLQPALGEPADTGWPKLVEGLSSGEGLKWAVRDRITKREADGATVSDVEVDPGVADKRILVVESEFAQVLRQCARAGNTLSSTIRCAWDSGRLQTLTKNDPITATDAHISIIGHITSDELRAELTQTDSANGFANRFLFMCAKRSKSLPFGGEPMPEEVISHFASRIAAAAAKARTLSAVDMSEDARAIWSAVYPKLSAGHQGLFGAVTARAEAQCLRLALTYALMDQSDTIRGDHIMASLAVWKRAEESARYIFGRSIGDPKADEIHRALQNAGNAGLTRTQISQLFSRHETTERIGVALDLLKAKGMARCERQQTGGAPKEVWLCV